VLARRSAAEPAQAQVRIAVEMARTPPVESPDAAQQQRRRARARPGRGPGLTLQQMQDRAAPQVSMRHWSAV
jgi:hypothetical protein